MQTQENVNLKELFLLEAADVAAFEGLNEEMLEHISIKLELDKAYHKLLFPLGITSLVEFYEEYANAELQANLINKEKPARISEQVKLALNTKLNSTKFSKLFIKQIAKFYANPLNNYIGLKAAWKTADMIWYYAGDETLDFNYYSKRTLLSSIIISSTLFYINDDSESDYQTTEFIDYSLKKIAHISKLKQQIKSFVPDISDIPVIRMFF